jgi:hypothetical protein
LQCVDRYNAQLLYHVQDRLVSTLSANRECRIALHMLGGISLPPLRGSMHLVASSDNRIRAFDDDLSNYRKQSQPIFHAFVTQ